MNIKYHAQFLLDREKDNPTAKLRYRIKWDGNIVAFNLGYRVEIQKWSKETQRCKANTTHGDKKIFASIINRKIQEFESACQRTFQKFEVDVMSPCSKQFRESFNCEVGRTSKTEIVEEKSFFDVFDLFTQEESRNSYWKDKTLMKMNTLKNKLTEFNPNLKFDNLDEEG